MPAYPALQPRFARTPAFFCLVLLLLFACLPAARASDTESAQSALGVFEQQYGATARLRIERWQSLIRTGMELGNLEKLQQVNAFFNEVEFINDIDHWGVEDYWATPTQLLASNGGDCEDFSIAKYFTLRQMGIPAEHLRLTYVKALELNQAHMVLTYFATPDADPLVLDNLINEIHTSSLRNDLLPVYSFNADGLWLAREQGTEQHVGKPERLSRWNEVVARISTDQLQLVQVDLDGSR